MARDVLWHALIQVQWPELVRLVTTILLCWLTWLLSKHWYAKEWRRFASEKARDELRAAEAELAKAARRMVRLQAECAKLRGQIAAARVRLSEPAQLELVEKTGARQ